MSAERVPSGVTPLRMVEPPRDDGIAAWLDVLVKLLRVPPGEAEGIREELESHLRERVRDLVVTGRGENEATQQAVSELGDAAGLAQRYREARAFPRRRIVMNVSMFAAAGIAAVIGVATISSPVEPPRVSVFAPEREEALTQPALTKTFRVDLHNVPLVEAIDLTSASLGMPVRMLWSPMNQLGVEQDATIRIDDQTLTVPSLVQMLNDQIVPVGWELDYRFQEGQLVLAPDTYFDRQEVVLASYDLSGLYEASAEEVVHLFGQFVHRENWVDNGGDMASVRVVGSKAFVQAPKRYHVQIEWFITELSKAPKVVSGTRTGQADALTGPRSKATTKEQQDADAARMQGLMDKMASREAEIAMLQDQLRMLTDAAAADAKVAKAGRDAQEERMKALQNQADALRSQIQKTAEPNAAPASK